MILKTFPKGHKCVELGWVFKINSNKLSGAQHPLSRYGREQLHGGGTCKETPTKSISVKSIKLGTADQTYPYIYSIKTRWQKPQQGLQRASLMEGVLQINMRYISDCRLFYDKLDKKKWQQWFRRPSISDRDESCLLQ